MTGRRLAAGISGGLVLSACTSSPCLGEGATADCVVPSEDDAYYVAQSQAYFDTMDTEASGDTEMAYGELVARWEWPPWLLLTGYTRERLIAGDALLALYPSTVSERECRAFDTNPFGRCRVVFYYEAHEGRPCPIYEEFTFDDRGEVTFIEAWSDLPGFLPMDAEDPWAEADDVPRLATRIPGLGRSGGLHLALESEEMRAVASDDPEVADFVYRASDWGGTWLEALDEAGDDLWERGCGWDSPL